MKKLLQKVDRIRASGKATLNLEPASAHYHLSGKSYPVTGMDTPDYKSRITLLIGGLPMDFTLSDII